MDRLHHRPRRLRCAAVSATLLVAAAAAAVEVPPTALATLGLDRSGLGLTVHGDWLGAVEAAAVPWLRPDQSRMLADPLLSLELAGNLLALARLGPRSLDHAATVFMLHPHRIGFRGLPTPLPRVAAGAGGLTAALASLETAGGLAPVTVLPPATVEPVAASAAEKALPQELRAPVAELVAALAEASRWVDRSWLAVPPEILAAAVADPTVARELPAAARWWPALDRAARDGDDVARGYAALVAAAALERAAAELRGVTTGWHGRWEVASARGRVIVAGVGDDSYRCDGDCLLIVDLGGDDVYRGTAGAGVGGRAAVVAAVLDLGGEDDYGQEDAVAGPGAGLGGVGMVLDLGGDDRYEGAAGCCGWGLLGFGVVDDRGGDDDYRARSAAQGAAVFGGGLLLDRGGADRYLVLGEGQGFGGPDGVGMLVDLDGDDDYRAEPDPRLAGRADYHVDGSAAASNAQGAGVGRRGDAADGHMWAGGLGVVVDVAGDDRYRAGTFAQGSGYQLGTGLLLDGAGDDRYRSVYFSQGAASHGGVGVVLDAAGADLHWLEVGAGLGYGWDAAVGIAADLAGDDVWSARRTALGRADRHAFGLLLERDGCDIYDVPPGVDGFGAVDDGERELPPGMTPASAGAAQSGIFLDLGGRDHYPAGGSGAGDDRSWVWPDRSGGWAGHDVGVGLDAEW